VGEEVEEFVAEDGHAGWLEADDGDSGFDLGLEVVENFEEKSFGAVEHSEVVQRASAAEVGLRDSNLVAGGLEDFYGSAGGGGEEVVIEGVGPEEDWG
jgi:hypothetical protein